MGGRNMEGKNTNEKKLKVQQRMWWSGRGDSFRSFSHKRG